MARVPVSCRDAGHGRRSQPRVHTPHQAARYAHAPARVDRGIVALTKSDLVDADWLDLVLPLLPGVSTASEVMTAMADDYRFLKLFPATAVGGVAMLKGLAGPFPDVAFCPTGGISLKTAPEFLSLPNVRVCGGSWLTPADAIAAGDWARITQLAREAQALRA